MLYAMFDTKFAWYRKNIITTFKFLATTQHSNAASSLSSAHSTT